MGQPAGHGKGRADHRSSRDDLGRTGVKLPVTRIRESAGSFMIDSSSTKTEGASVQEAYRIYTTQFDVEVLGDRLYAALGPLSGKDSQALDQAWHAFETGLLSWKTRLLIVAAEASARIRDNLGDVQRADTVVSLLIDHSGSMRGQKMLFATATADVVQEFMQRLGISCEG